MGSSAEGHSWAITPGRRAIMQGNRRRDTTPEVAVRHVLHALGLRYRVDFSLPFDRRRKADIAFTRAKVAVFIDGCFWHGCPEHYLPPKVNSGYWAEKVSRNQARDADTSRRLADVGWIVMRFWEHEDPVDIAMAVRQEVQGLSGHQPQATRAGPIPERGTQSGAQRWTSS